MLMLVFQLGNDRYALETSHVVEIVPSLFLRKLPHAPEYVGGIFNYRGTIVPVIDLCQLSHGRPCDSCLSTRILLVQIGDNRGSSRYLGLRAERVTETLKVAESDLVSQGIAVADAPYLGKIINDAQGMIQCVRVEHILPGNLADSLFQEAMEQK